ncbi:MAG: hypothetical protein P4L46_12480 [Fimbriimonas sp.]|nr:hypothetical protein [Fimbriimonas sp.]
MTSVGRAFLGALLGALLTLCIHPASRPFMIGLCWRIPPSVLLDSVDANAMTLPEPSSLAQASLWEQLAATRIRNFEKLSNNEWKSLIAIAGAAQGRDPTNAFWPQIQAVLFDDRGDTPAAVKAWIAAAKCSTWNDYQTARLLNARERLKQISGTKASWQLAFLYYARSDDVASCLERLTKHLLQNLPDNTADSLELRFATLLNGDLIRRYARSTKTNVDAMNIVELATFPSNLLATNVTPRLVHSAHIEILSNFRTILHRQDYCDVAKRIFSNCESWRAFTVRDTNDEDVAQYSAVSVLAASVAGAFMVLSALGVLIWTIGKFVEWRLSRFKEIKWQVAVAIGILLGSLVYALTQYVPASFVLALCAAFLTVAPDRSRKARPTDLGPLFVFMAIVLGIACSALLATFFVMTTAESIVILPNVGVPPDYLEKPVLAGLSAVIFGLVLLIAPFWAIAHRVGTPHVLGLILTKFGAFIFVSCLTLSVILGPLAVYADLQVEHVLFQFLTNEPLHYYVIQ